MSSFFRHALSQGPISRLSSCHLTRKVFQSPTATCRNPSISVTAAAPGSSSPSSSAHSNNYPEHLLSAMLSGFLAPYWEICPSAEHAIAEVESWLPNAHVGFDHFAFRTFGVGGNDSGISSVSTWFIDLGYTEGGSFEFVNKKLRARWYKPPSPDLPRLFVSELKVEEMSEQTQKIIKKYAGGNTNSNTVPYAFSRYGPATGFLGVTPWAPPTIEEYKILSEESEYAAWVLVNGWALNHTTLAVHRLTGLEGGISALNSYLKHQGLTFSEEGGEIKASPDGLLLQSSTVADSREFEFAGGEVVLVPGAYIEFAERLVLPEYTHLKGSEIEEWHRRDGFEAASADRIFESTTAAAQKLANND
ncbi:hypothetical protein Ndes2437A_g03814 [Nannochloris sp. 'desiccata']